MYSIDVKLQKTTNKKIVNIENIEILLNRKTIVLKKKLSKKCLLKQVFNHLSFFLVLPILELY